MGDVTPVVIGAAVLLYVAIGLVMLTWWLDNRKL